MEAFIMLIVVVGVIKALIMASDYLDIKKEEKELKSSSIPRRGKLSEKEIQKALRKIEEDKSSNREPGYDNQLVETTRNIFVPRVEYEKYLKSSRWRQMREYYHKLRGSKCEQCNKHINLDEMNLHHVTYERLLHEEPGDVAVLCRQCHTETHEYHGLNNSYYPILNQKQRDELTDKRFTQNEYGKPAVSIVSRPQRERVQKRPKSSK
jgi:cytochrome c553